MSQPNNVPTPVSSERDADGRLIGLSIDSVPALTTPEANPWLVAVDSSDNALRAVAHAARQADEMRTCALHLVNVQAWLSLEAAEMELAHHAWIATERARALLDAEGRPWRLHVAMGEPAERIHELALRLNCGGIVVGRRGSSAMGVAENLLFGSVTTTLQRLGGPPLLVVP